MLLGLALKHLSPFLGLLLSLLDLKPALTPSLLDLQPSEQKLELPCSYRIVRNSTLSGGTGDLAGGRS